MPDMLFVYIDTTSNAVFSKGISHLDFVEGIVHQPNHLLLLDPAADVGEYEPHSGLKVINGSQAVNQFFTNKHYANSNANKWMDFNDPTLLKELSPLEISELLYFGHMKTQLHSPFFYKLQNNFVYFNLGSDTLRVYYRYLDEFYRILANKLMRIVQERFTERRSLFRRTPAVARLETETLKELYPLFQEGLVFCLEQATFENQIYQVPIYLSDEKGWRKNTNQFDQQMATLTYDGQQKRWTLALDFDELGLALR